MGAMLFMNRVYEMTVLKMTELFLFGVTTDEDAHPKRFNHVLWNAEFADVQ